MVLSLLFFFSAQFDIRFFLPTLPYLSLVSLISSSVCHYLGFADKFFYAKKKKKIFYSKVASHILCPSFVCKLPHECEDITKNAWRTPLNAQCNIEYRLPQA